MIEILFTFGTETILVVIKGEQILFGNTGYGCQLATIDGLQLDYLGVCKEFPDLEGKNNWKEESIKRFKEKIKSFKTEQERADYIIQDLKKFGYIPVQIKKQGFRSKKIK